MKKSSFLCSAGALIAAAALLAATPAAGPPSPVSDKTPARAAEWPQWRGPNRNAVSTEKGLLKEWPAGRRRSPLHPLG